MTPSFSSHAAPGSPYARPPREPSTQERVARARTLAGRALGHWRLALLLFVVGVAIAVGIAYNVKRIYQSRCVVLFKSGIRTDEQQETSAERAQKMAPKLKEVLTTRSHLETIINEFHLYPKTLEARGMLDAVEEMRTHIGFRGKESDTFEISFDNEDADITQKVAERLAEAMIGQFTSANVEAARQQADFLGQEENRSEEELEAANKALATFLGAHPEFAAEARDANRGAGIPIMPNAGGSAASSMDPQIAALYRQRARIQAEMKATSASAAAGSGAPMTAPANRSIESLTKARDDAAKAAAVAQSDLADKRMHLTEEHPDVIAARQQADAAARALHIAEAQLASAQVHSGTKVPSGLDNDAPAPGNSGDMQKKLDAIAAQIYARQSNLAHPTTPQASAPSEPVNQLVALETDWQRLVRAMGETKSHQEDLRSRAERAKLQASAINSNGGDQMEIIDPAFRPMRPFKGGRTNAALVGLAVAGMAAIFYAFARVLFSDLIIDAADVDALHVIPVLGVLPKLEAPGAPGGAGKRGAPDAA